MLDGRDAILQAELAAGGVDQCGVWQVFADRGMGYSATSAGDGEVVTEAFDLEDHDGDGIGDVCDDDPFDQYVCQDVDTDTCDDCTVTGGPPDTANDGPDNEPDGLCDAGDPDDDNDGFDDDAESYIGTDPLDACPDVHGSPGLCPGPTCDGDDAWPPDLDVNAFVDVVDVLKFKGNLLKHSGEPGYIQRLDLYADGFIDIVDVLELKPVIITHCTNP